MAPVLGLGSVKVSVAAVGTGNVGVAIAGASQAKLAQEQAGAVIAIVFGVYVAILVYRDR